MLSRLHIRIFGDVQGVFFRAGVQDQAGEIRGINGWVRNLEDSSVEVMVEGEKQKLVQLLDWCMHGPAGASVEKIEKEWLKYKGEFSEFSIKYS
jgi:acylphosphatase